MPAKATTSRDAGKTPVEVRRNHFNLRESCHAGRDVYSQRLPRRIGGLGVAPHRRAGAVAPVARPIEGVYADAVELAHLMHPPRMHPIGVIVGRLADIAEPEPAVQRIAGDALGARPGGRLVDAVRNAVAGESELAGEMAVDYWDIPRFRG
jgi:hypothetical protein